MSGIALVLFMSIDTSDSWQWTSLTYLNHQIWFILWATTKLVYFFYSEMTIVKCVLSISGHEWISLQVCMPGNCLLSCSIIVWRTAAGSVVALWTNSVHIVVIRNDIWSNGSGQETTRRVSHVCSVTFSWLRAKLVTSYRVYYYEQTVLPCSELPQLNNSVNFWCMSCETQKFSIGLVS